MFLTGQTSEEQRKGIHNSLSNLFDQSRVDAKIDIVLGEEEGKLEQIGKYSAQADLVIIGMRPPRENEELTEYAGYYEYLLEETESFPSLIMLLAGEEVEFKDIFKDV